MLMVTSLYNTSHCWSLLVSVSHSEYMTEKRLNYPDAPHTAAPTVQASSGCRPGQQTEICGPPQTRQTFGNKLTSMAS